MRHNPHHFEDDLDRFGGRRFVLRARDTFCAGRVLADAEPLAFFAFRAGRALLAFRAFLAFLAFLAFGPFLAFGALLAFGASAVAGANADTSPSTIVIGGTR